MVKTAKYQYFIAFRGSNQNLNILFMASPIQYHIYGLPNPIPDNQRMNWIAYNHEIFDHAILPS